MSFPPKTIIVFCDGTGQDGLITDEGSSASHYSNVLRLSRAIKQTFDEEGKNKRLQVVLYQSGVGVPLDFEAEDKPHPETKSRVSTILRKFWPGHQSDNGGNSQSMIEAAIGQAAEALISTSTKAQQGVGTAVASKIRDAYNFIAQNYTKGDYICIFGFSRGAYTARKLSGLIDRLGLLSPAQMGYFFKYWKQLNGVEEGDPPLPTEAVPIKCVGIWDTVGSVYNKYNALKLHDTKLPGNVEIALHAVAFHENRSRFLCTLYEGVTSSKQVLKQIWFPGAHSDVGGGYADRELADVSLTWMVGEIKNFVGINTDFIAASMSKHNHDWGKAEPKDAYAVMEVTEGKGTAIAVGKQHRLAQLTKDAILHPSLFESPDMPGLITITRLKEIGWRREDHEASLNEYETIIKNTWFDRAKGDIETPVFEGFNDMDGLF